MSEGWISLHRKITEHWIWADPIKLKWWLDLLLSVNHSGKKINIGNDLFECRRGQSVTSLQSWSKRWGTSKSTVKRFFELLKNDNMVIIENLTKTTRITVCNYEDYQDLRNDNETQAERRRNGCETQTNPNNNDNNDNNEEKEISTIVDTKKKDEERKAEIERKKQEQKKKSDAAKAATIKRKELFYEELIPYVERYGKDMIRKFFEYWTEQNKSGTKMKYEIEKTWDLARRLGTWNNREPIGGKNLFSQQPTSTEEKECKWECQAIGLYRTGTYNQYLADVKRNNNQEVKFLGYVE